MKYQHFFFVCLLTLLQSDVQISDLKAQLDEAIGAKLKVEKSKRDLDFKIEELENAVEISANKVCIRSFSY